MADAPPVPDDVAVPPDNAETTTSGLASKVLQAGTSDERPAATDTVEVHYSGWTTDGKLFDSSVTRGTPSTFGLQRVIPGWRDGLRVMRVGDKVRMWIPEDQAYKGRKGAPQGMLVFDVELIAINP